MSRGSAPPQERDLLGLPLLRSVLDIGTSDGHGVAARVGHALGDAAVRFDGASLVNVQPGSRALVALQLSGGAVPTTVFAKHFATSEKAHQVYRTMCALSADVFGAEMSLGVPRPLGLVTDLALVLYAPAMGDHLDEVVDGDGAERAIRDIARWLACLHGSELRLSRHFDVSNELVNLREWAALVDREFPATAEDRAAALVDALARWASRLRLDARCPIHKDLHYRHVIVGAGIAVVDFDEMCHGDPNFDLAHFCMYLRLLEARTGCASADLERAFLDEYGRCTGWRRDDRLRFFTVYTCIKIARQLCLMRGVVPIAMGLERARQVRVVLDHAMSVA